MALLLEFCVMGTPISAQASSRSKRRWKAKVALAARALWPQETQPLEHPLEVRIGYFHEGPAPDLDNMAKPMLDALEGLVYLNDAQCITVKLSKRELNGSFSVKDLTVPLAAAFIKGGEFVRVRVFDAENIQDLEE